MGERFAVLALAAACLPSCNDGDLETRRIVDTKTTLISVGRLIRVGKEFTGEEPPRALGRLVDWIGLHASREASEIDFAGRTIRDAWEREIVVVVSDGRVTALGSCGGNGVWECGGGDDIVVTLEEAVWPEKGEGGMQPATDGEKG